MNPYEELRHVVETAVADLKAGVGDTSFIIRYLQHALKTPRRNCDVGTAKKQHKRFMHFCTHVNKSVCIDCPLIGNTSLCQLQWAQLPYKEGENK